MTRNNTLWGFSDIQVKYRYHGSQVMLDNDIYYLRLCSCIVRMLIGGMNLHVGEGSANRPASPLHVIDVLGQLTNRITAFLSQ